MPPLREVREELDVLWPKVLKTASARAGKPVPELSEATKKTLIQALKQAILPGNIRDLYGVAYHLLAFWDTGEDRAVDKALASMNTGAISSGPVLPVNREVAYRFAMDMPITDILKEIGKLDIDRLEDDFHAFLAKRLYEAEDQLGRSTDHLCNRKKRTLREWKNKG
jgi:DNA-binding NtrC family response regulator